MVDIHSEEYILGQNIRKYRLEKGWSQKQLSDAVDIDRADISKYENSKPESDRKSASWHLSFIPVRFGCCCLPAESWRI